ncbi:MAG TPA: WYL domain-containing protein [Brevundimonas sp.]|jgi:predicted DNA-binding transcriptional regulator YafY
MRASRLLSILLILQTRGRTTASALAAEFEVSVRTVYRDIDQLSAAGVPVYADRGREGGFQLMEGYRTRLTGLTDAEAETLFLGGLAGPAAEMGFSQALMTMQLKLLAALPPERQAAAERMAARFHLDPAGWYQADTGAARLPELAQAVWAQHLIQIRYESWKGPVERTLEPLGLILKGGVWYIAARPAGKTKAEARTYRVSNILALEVSQEAFSRPEDFDLAGWWTATSNRFEAGLFIGEAGLKLTGEGLRRLAQLGPRYATIAARTPVPTPGAWVGVTVPIESIAHAARELLRLGADAEVLAPPNLRTAMAETTQRMAALYRD